MAQRQPHTSQSTPPLPPLAAVTLHAAGIDLGAEGPFGALPPRDDLQPVRGFGASTGDVAARAAWRTTGGITTIALASTGVYGLPLLARLETRGCAVLLVDPPQVPQSKGRPTSDVHDGPWSPRLPTFGLLASVGRTTRGGGGAVTSDNVRCAAPLRPSPSSTCQRPARTGTASDSLASVRSRG